MITGLNHITLVVSDITRSLSFYSDLLNFQPHARWNNGAYLSCGDLWLCLSVDEVSVSTDYTHIAFGVSKEEYPTTADRLESVGVAIWKNNKSEGNSLYFLDPDHHKLELHDGDLVSRLLAVDQAPYEGWVRLDNPQA